MAPSLLAAKAVDEVRRHLPERWSWLTDYSIAGNGLWRIMGLAGSVLVALVLGRLLRLGLNSAARRLAAGSKPILAVASAALARTTGFVSLVVGLNLGLEFLLLNPTVDSLAQASGAVLLVIALGYIAYELVDVVDQSLRRLSSGGASKLDDMLVPIVTASLRLTVVVLALVQIATILSNKPVTSVIAGLGVGGLAVGLAAQDTIKNFFGSLMIFSDRPFELGEEIKVGDIGGKVEAVGFRSTRLRTDDGFLVTIPNGDLAGKTIVNISKRNNLGRQFNLGLAQDLAPEKIERAVAIVREVLLDHEGSQTGSPPRVFFNEFAPNALNLSVAYWYYPPDWWRFVAFNERVNFEILRRFAAEGIALASAAQTLRIEQSGPGEPRPE
jgi:MscS family membrane protein